MSCGWYSVKPTKAPLMVLTGVPGNSAFNRSSKTEWRSPSGSWTSSSMAFWAILALAAVGAGVAVGVRLPQHLVMAAEQHIVNAPGVRSHGDDGLAVFPGREGRSDNRR